MNAFFIKGTQIKYQRKLGYPSSCGAQSYNLHQKGEQKNHVAFIDLISFRNMFLYESQKQLSRSLERGFPPYPPFPRYIRNAYDARQ